MALLKMLRVIELQGCQSRLLVYFIEARHHFDHPFEA